MVEEERYKGILRIFFNEYCCDGVGVADEDIDKELNGMNIEDCYLYTFDVFVSDSDWEDWDNDSDCQQFIWENYIDIDYKGADAVAKYCIDEYDRRNIINIRKNKIAHILQRKNIEHYEKKI